MKPVPNFKIVILEDDDFYNRILSRYLKINLEKIGFLKGFTVNVLSYTSFIDCKRNLSPDIDLVLTDYYLSDGYTAPYLMEKLRQRGIQCKVIVISRLHSVQTAIVPLLDGASEFVQKNKHALKNCLYITESILTERLKRLN